MLFAPTTERSPKIRALYATIYGFLILGAVTMIAPFLIMVTGSIEPSSTSEDLFVPSYLVDREELWQRYLVTKYHGVDDLFRMAWNEPDAVIDDAGPTLNDGQDIEGMELWETFLAESQPPNALFAVGFLRPNARMPSTNAFAFRDWLEARYGSLEEINRSLLTEFPRLGRILPPLLRMDGAPAPQTPLVEAFEAFSATLPLSQRFGWDVGGYYRANILPRVVSADITDFNAQFGTTYTSYAEVPFSSTAPEVAEEPWFFFVSQLLRPDFVQMTPIGEANMVQSGLGKEEFIRTTAQPDDLRVVSIDTLYAEWAASRGIEDARIPQASLDRAAFDEESSFWRNQFLSLNYRLVLDEILFHGRAISNTIILVVLSVCGSLIINPLAAYALSRYKLRSSFHILLFFLATIAFPAEVTMIPVFLQLKEFHLLNTFGALVLPGLANGFSIFLLKGFFDSLPRELYEAAELDGASEFTTFWTITMNLSKPILAVIALSTFVSAYGTFFYALILAPDPKMWTVMVYVYQLRQAVDPPVVYASLILTAIPTLIVFVTCQNIILRGIVVPSDK